MFYDPTKHRVLFDVSALPQPPHPYAWECRYENDAFLIHTEADKTISSEYEVAGRITTRDVCAYFYGVGTTYKTRGVETLSEGSLNELAQWLIVKTLMDTGET